MLKKNQTVGHDNVISKRIRNARNVLNQVFGFLIILKVKAATPDWSVKGANSQN